MILNIEALMREAFESLKAQVEAKEKLKKEQKLRRTVIEEEETSRQMQVNEVAYTKVEDRYHGTTRESRKGQVTLVLRRNNDEG